MSSAQACEVWEREKQFYEALKKSGERLTKGSVDGLTNIALDDEWICYKHVVALLARQIRKAAPGNRISVLYVLSNILRFSKRRYGCRDKYADRVVSAVPEIFSPLSECPSSQTQKIVKVLETWRKDEIFDDNVLKRIFKALGLCKYGHCWDAKAVPEDSGSTGRLIKAGRVQGKDVIGTTSPGGKKSFHPTFYPTVDSPGGPDKSCGGSNSGVLANAQEGEDEEYDPLSAADYIDGCNGAQQPMYSINLPPIPPLGDLLLSVAGEETVGDFLGKKSDALYGVESGCAHVQHQLCRMLSKGSSQEVTQKCQEDGGGMLYGQDSMWSSEYRHDWGDAWAQTGFHGTNVAQQWTNTGNYAAPSTSISEPEFHPIDYMGTCGFGQGMDGPPEIPPITWQLQQTESISGNAMPCMRDDGMGDLRSGDDVACYAVHGMEDAQNGLGMRTKQSVYLEISEKDPQKESCRSAASSIMDIAESMAGSICSHRDTWETDGGDIPGKIIPHPPLDSPPPLPMDSSPETPPPPPPLPPPDMASVQWSDGKCGEKCRLEPHTVLAGG